MIVVGAHGNNAVGGDSGAAYTFRFDGTEWVQEKKLIGSDTRARDDFGVSVAAEGDTVVVGASGNNDRDGSVYVFRFDGTDWAEEEIFTAPDPDDGKFGSSVAVSGDMIVVGAQRFLRAYVYRR